MLKKITILIFICFITSCADENSVEKEIAAIAVETDVKRFDQVFLNATTDDLPQLKKTYPMFFPASVPDSIWVYTMNDPLQKELKQEINITFSDFSSVHQDIKSVFQHIKYYFPEYQVPEIFTVTTEDYRKKVILTDKMLLIALNTYLGKDHQFYEGIQRYISQNFTKEQIPIDIADEFAKQQVPFLRDRTFLGKIVYFGKIAYLKSLLVPSASKAAQFGYTEKQQQWANANEAQIWTYFIEKELLYSTDNTLDNRFLNLAPFSKFYLELDSESPGGIGRYIGYEIVASYMKNNNVSLQELLQTSAEEIFTNSKYKPKK